MREDATSSAALALCAKPNVAAKPAAIFNASRRVLSTYVSYAHPSVSFVSHRAPDRARTASSPRHRAFSSPVIHARLIADVTRRPRLSAPARPRGRYPRACAPRARERKSFRRAFARASLAPRRARPRARVHVASRRRPARTFSASPPSVAAARGVARARRARVLREAFFAFVRASDAVARWASGALMSTVFAS